MNIKIMILLLTHTMMLSAQYQFVLTGGPGVGINSIINLLEQNGHTVIPAAKDLLFHDAKESNTLDICNSSYLTSEFQIKLIEKQLSLEKALENKCSFLNTSYIDIIAFAEYNKIPFINSHLIKKDKYSLIFFIEPLPKVFFDTNQFGSYEESLKLHDYLKNFYRNIGYHVIEVPFDTPQRRMDFILKHAFSKIETDLIQPIWDNKATEWSIHIDNLQNDINRLWQSDPVMWKLLKNVKDLTVLDIGCGEGYISRQLAQSGAQVIATDISPKLIAIAKEKSQSFPNLEYRIESCSNMESIFSASIDKIVCNYVLMDIPDLENTVKEINRMLKINGEAVIIISHPCFPMENIIKIKDFFTNNDTLFYGWKSPYFTEHIMKLPKWGFSDHFTIFHRPLSTYWKIFKQNNLQVIELEEPTLSDDAKMQLEESVVNTYKFAPHSIAFLLKKIA